MSPPLTLIAAVTPLWGIGKGGSLPWPMLKQEMAYFARVTKRAPTPLLASISSAPRFMNAVIMGRKTWESIPSRLRPLKDRINVVISRTPEALRFPREIDTGEVLPEGPFAASSISDALDYLESAYAKESSGIDTATPRLGHVFIIGGAKVYNMALQLDNCNRVLLTKVEGDWECDTFFPTKLGESEGGQGSLEWRKQTLKELEGWVGEKLGNARRVEDKVSWQWEMWTREPCGNASE